MATRSAIVQPGGALAVETAYAAAAFAERLGIAGLVISQVVCHAMPYLQLTLTYMRVSASTRSYWWPPSRGLGVPRVELRSV